MNDPETKGPNFRIDDWTVTMYTKSKSETTGSWLDWVKDSTIKASEVEIKENLRSLLRSFGKLCKPNNGEGAEWNLQNLYVYQPVLGLDDRGIVYLLARIKFLHRHAWVLAVDMRNKRVQAMVKIATERGKDFCLAYCASTVSSYMEPEKQSSKTAHPSGH
jgi:hypothetical protein